MNYAQITSLEAQGLVIETQMTYEELNPEGTVTVYRLLRVPAAKLVAIQGRLNEQARAQEQSLEKTRQELTEPTTKDSRHNNLILFHGCVTPQPCKTTRRCT